MDTESLIRLQGLIHLGDGTREQFYERGDIWVVSKEGFSNRGDYQTAPWLIVQNDALNERLDDVIIVAITDPKNFTARELKRLQTIIPLEKNLKNGLRLNSVIKCTQLATVDKKHLKHWLGIAGPLVMDKIDEKLSKVLAP